MEQCWASIASQQTYCCISEYAYAINAVYGLLPATLIVLMVPTINSVVFFEFFSFYRSAAVLTPIQWGRWYEEYRCSEKRTTPDSCALEVGYGESLL